MLVLCLLQKTRSRPQKSDKCTQWNCYVFCAQTYWNKLKKHFTNYQKIAMTQKNCGTCTLLKDLHKSQTSYELIVSKAA